VCPGNSTCPSGIRLTRRKWLPFIPPLTGHGTPTTILLGRNQQVISKTIRAVRGIRGENGEPADPATAPVWREICDHVDSSTYEGVHVSVADAPRESFARHPWPIGGGGAAELKELIDGNVGLVLGELATSIGITSFTLEDDLYQLDAQSVRRLRIPTQYTRPLIFGELLRDWMAQDSEKRNIFPYDDQFRPIVESCSSHLFAYMWPARTNLSRNVMFGGKSKVQTGLRWYEYGRLTAHKLQTPLSIAVAFVASHNNFVLDYGGHHCCPAISQTDSAV